MNKLKYFLQFLGIIFLFFIYKLLGLKYSSILSGGIFMTLGPLFRSNKISLSNLSRAFPEMSEKNKKVIIKGMWNNYGKIFAEYVFLKNFRFTENFYKNVIVERKLF